MRYRIYFLIGLILCSAGYLFSQENRYSIKDKNFIPWSVLEKDGKHFCPLCGEEYEPKDFKKLHPKLSLSEWHANNLAPEYFENRIANISDVDFYNSLDKSIFLSGKENFIQGNAFKFFLQKKQNEKDNERFFSYSQFDENSFITANEYVSLLNSNSGKRDTLLKQANDIASLKFPYGTFIIDLKDTLGFNADLGGARKYGFHYLSWLSNLPCAYLLTRDEKYVKAFDEIFKLWYKQRNSIANSLSQYDVVWYELGIAARIPVLIDAFRLFKNHPLLSEEAKEELSKIFLASGRWLYLALKRNPYHPYNWPVYSSISLTYLAINFPEFIESGEWLKTGKKSMEEHLKNDIYDDGGYLERAPGYSINVFKLLYRYISLFKYFSSDIVYYNSYKPLFEKMVQFFVYTLSPLGTACPFNDSRRNDMVDFIYTYGKEQSDFVGVIEPFLKNDKKSITSKITYPKETSINLPNSGFAVMRSGWSKEALMMIINYGPPANHNHEDILDFEIYAYGKPVALDAGLGQIGYDDPLWKPWYRNAISHNMVIINDSSVNRGETNVHDIKWSSQNNLDYFEAVHEGYKNKFDAVHRRRIAFIKPEYWVISDEIITKKAIKTNFLFHSPQELEAIPNGYKSREMPGFMLLLPEGEKAIRKIKNGSCDLTGLPQNQKQEINYVSIEKIKNNAEGGNSYTTLVYPYKDTVTKFRFSEHKYNDEIVITEIKRARFTDKLIFSNGKNNIFLDGIESDARFIFIRYEESDINKISVTEGSFLKINGKIFLNSNRKMDKEFDWNK